MDCEAEKMAVIINVPGVGGTFVAIISGGS